MPNISCSPSCKAENRFCETDVLGKRIRVKNYICSSDGIHYRQKEEPIRLQLSVSPTSYCPAACPFCIAGDTKTRRFLDIGKLRGTMERLRDEERVRGIKITGGEPFYDFPLLNEVICLLYETFGSELELSVSTNGMGLERVGEIRYLKYLESIHVSRHHYDDRINRAFFGGADVPDAGKLKAVIGSVPYRDMFVLNCLLLKGGIDSVEEAHRFLDHAIDMGAAKVGFMVCAPANAYARSHGVSYETVIRRDDPALLFTRGFQDYEFCHCQDGVYASPAGEIMEFYGRYTPFEDVGYCRGLVYEADDRLRAGFGGEIIL